MTRPAAEPITTVLRPPSRWPGLGLRELWQTRRIVGVLLKRLLMVRYRQAALGFFWIILQPLLLTVIITVFLGLVLGRETRHGLPFPVFLFSAWVVFRPFVRVLSEGGGSIAGNGALIKRLYLPRAIFPISVTLATFVDMAALAGALVLMLVVYGITPGIGLLALPILIAMTYATGMGTAFFFAAASLKYPDMQFIQPLIQQSWFWASPIIYSSAVITDKLGDFGVLYYLNPMALVIEGVRWAFAQTPSPPLEAWLLGGLSASALLLGGYVYFRMREAVFADLM